MSTALTVLREELGQQLGMMKLIPNGSFTSAAAGSITSTDVLRDSNLGGGQYKGWIIFRPGAASSADFVRYAGLLINTTGLLAHTGANYADTTVGSEVVELWRPGARPDLELLASLNRCLEYEYVSSLHALSHGSDADYGMEATTDTNWTDVLTPTTSAKTTGASVAPYGPRAYDVVNDAVNEGTRSSGGSMRIGMGRQFSGFTVLQAFTGTASFQPYDLTNSVAFGTAVTTSERAFTLLAQRSQAMPSTGAYLGFNILNTVNPGRMFVNAVWKYHHDQLFINLPTFITESFMLPKIMQARPRVTLAENVYDALSFDFVPLIEGVDYWTQFNHADSTAYRVRFAEILPSTGGHPYEWPLFCEYRRPQSDLVTMSAETDAVNVPKHNLLPRWKIDALETI